MDNYCRTCMRDSNKFSPIFEEMTYGGISLQEAIEDVCQLEIYIEDDLPVHVCRDCALKLYDIVKFKMEAHEVHSAMRKLMAIHPRIKVEIDESVEETSFLSPTTENIKVEEISVSHSIEVSYDNVTDPFGNTTNSDAGNSNFEPSQSRFKVDNNIRGMDSFEAIHPRIKVEIDESVEETSLLSPTTENIKVEEISVSHSIEVSYNNVTDPFGNATNSDAGNFNFEPSQSRFKVDNHIRGMDSFEAIHPRIKVEIDESVEEVSYDNVTDPFGNTTNSDAWNSNFEPSQSRLKVDNNIRGMDSFEAIHPRIKVEIDESVEETSFLSPTTENIKVEEISVSHSIEVSYNNVTDPFGNATNSDAGNFNFEPSQSRFKVDNNIRGMDSFEVNIAPGDTENKSAAICRDTHELPSILGVECWTSKVPECIDNGSRTEEIFWKNTQGLAEGKGNLFSQSLYSNGKEFVGDESRIKGRKMYSKDLSSTCFNGRISILYDNAEAKGNLASREIYRRSDGTQGQPGRTEDDETTERGSVDSNSIVEQIEGECENATSNLSKTTGASVGAYTSTKNGVQSYICHVCDKTFCKKSAFKKHERIHLVEKQFECKICSGKFGMKCTLDRHKKIHELFSKSLRIDDRNDIKTSFSSELLKRGSAIELDKLPIQVDDTECKNSAMFIDLNVPHNEGENVDFPKSFICDRCRKEFCNKKDLLEHLILHYGQRSSSKRLLPEVRKTANNVPVDSNSINEPGLNVINGNKEENVMSRNESYGKKLVVDCALKIPATVGENNSGGKPFACQYCSKMFSKTSSRKRHERIHTGEKPFACKYCSKVFGTKFSREEHERIHTGEKPFACKYCSKVFRSISDRKKHEHIHTGEKPFACRFCSKNFLRKHHLTLHELIHTGEKPFSCKFCSKTFTQKHHLTRHELNHTRVT